MKRIFIVDDSPAIRNQLRWLLESQTDWQVCGEAENGLEGVDKAKKLQPDVIILDLSMPVMNGLQAACELKRLMPHVPLLMLTSFILPELEHEAYAAGIISVISKTEPVALVNKLSDVLKPVAE